MQELPQALERDYPVNGIRLHVMEFGDPEGIPLLFLHGFPEFWYGWRKQIAYFAQKGYRVLVPDQRGYNLSSKPKEVRAYQISELTQDIAALIQAVTIHKVVIVGHDWGAVITWNLASQYPQLLERAVIINVPYPKAIRQILRKKPDQWRRSWYIFFIQLPWLPEWLARWRKYHWMAKVLEITSLPGTFSPEDLDHYRQAWAQPGSFRAMLHWYRALRFGLNSSVNDRIALPLLIIWGVKDAFLRPEMAHASLLFCDQGRLIRVESATHWIHHEKSELVNRAIEEFIQEKNAG